MLDRQKLETLLANRFPGSTREQIAAAANAIMAMMSAAGPGRDRLRQGFGGPPTRPAKAERVDLHSAG